MADIENPGYTGGLPPGIKIINPTPEAPIGVPVVTVPQDRGLPITGADTVALGRMAAALLAGGLLLSWLFRKKKVAA